MSVYRRNTMTLLIFSSHFHSPDYPALTIFSWLWTCFLTASSCLLLCEVPSKMHCIWSPLSYHTEMDRNHRALLLWDTLHQSPVLLRVLPGNQKCKAPAILYPGYFSEFRSQQTTLTGGMRSLFWIKNEFTCCIVWKQWIPPSLVSLSRNVQPHVDIPDQLCGPCGQGGTWHKQANVWAVWHAPVWDTGAPCLAPA